MATDAKLGAGTSAAVANGFGKDSPYNAYLPYDIKQKAVFGELTYTTGKLTATAGGRYYDFSETRQFKSGGLFAMTVDVPGLPVPPFDPEA